MSKNIETIFILLVLAFLLARDVSTLLKTPEKLKERVDSSLRKNPIEIPYNPKQYKWFRNNAILRVIIFSIILLLFIIDLIYHG
jgi:hypothetical protein